MIHKMLRSVLAIGLVFAFGAATLQAQTGTIEGNITNSETGAVLPSANVFINELGKGAASDAEGNFTIEDVPYGTYKLRVSFVGYQTKIVPVTVDAETVTVSITLSPGVRGLEDVVVTAFGVERENRSIGYSSQSINTEDLAKVRETNFINSLQGKAAGVNITQGSGAIGSSSRITIRGISSLTGDNEPLFIIDGVYIDNSNFDPAGEFDGEPDYGNAAADINPENIKSITVLKGPNAAALYGSRAANGAIIIETKDGTSAIREGIGARVNSTVTFQDVAVLPDLQNQYGQGCGGQFQYVNGAGAGLCDGVDESWGPPLDGTPRVQWWTGGDTAPWEAHPDNVRDYFETGHIINNDVSVAGNYGDSNFRLSATNVLQKGTIPNSKLQSNNVSLTAGANLSDEFRAEGRISYNQTIGKNRPALGYSAENPMQQLTQWFGRQVDIHKLKDYKDDQGNPRNWNYNYHDNPYWMQYENTNRQVRDRVIGSVNLQYDVSDWVTIEGHAGNDFYQERREEVIAVGTLNDPTGDYSEDTYVVNQWRANASINANRQLTEDISLDTRLGVEMFRRSFENNYGRAPALSTPGVYNLQNSAVRQIIGDTERSKATNSVYGYATFGYDDFLYLDITGRNDWSSTLPADNNSYFYPSASLSFIFTDAFDLGLDWMSFGKLRASWTQVGSDTNPFQLQQYFNSGSPFGDLPTYTVQNRISNANLKPQITESLELGGEVRFFDDRMGLDLTYYNSTTRDQITPVQVSAASGYTQQVVNVGEIANRGIEATLNTTPVLNSNFQWDLTLNFAKNHNEVISLARGLDTFVHGSTWDVTVESRPGEEYGALWGYGFLRDDDGNIVVDNSGVPILDTSQKRNFGSYMPDWTGSVYNSFSYQNFDLSFLVDIRSGGSLNSVTYMFGRYTGILEETLQGRESGFVFQGGRWADGAVKQNGEPNDISVGAETFNKLTFFGNAESHIFDASYVKLRELRLTYNLPVEWMDNLPFRNMSVSAVGRNLWIIHKNVPHIDPETAFNSGNVQGLESNQVPSVRTFGFNISFGL